MQALSFVSDRRVASLSFRHGWRQPECLVFVESNQMRIGIELAGTVLECDICCGHVCIQSKVFETGYDQDKWQECVSVCLCAWSLRFWHHDWHRQIDWYCNPCWTPVKGWRLISVSADKMAAVSAGSLSSSLIHSLVPHLLGLSLPLPFSCSRPSNILRLHICHHNISLAVRKSGCTV